MQSSAVSSRVEAFCRRFGVSVPILLAPMAGACPVPLSAALANAGSMGAGGYRGVLLVKGSGNVEHRNALPGQVGDGIKRSRFSGLVVGTPGF